MESSEGYSYGRHVAIFYCSEECKWSVSSEFNVLQDSVQISDIDELIWRRLGYLAIVYESLQFHRHEDAYEHLLAEHNT